MAIRPFLLLSSRPQDDVVAHERAAVARHAGLAPEDVVQIRMERGLFTPLDLARYSGVLLGGSPYNMSDPESDKTEIQHRVERELGEVLSQVVEEDIPFLGLCYGVGALGHLIGCPIDTTFAEPVSAVTVDLTPAGRDDPILAGVPDSFSAFTGHKEACATAPAGATLLATSATCPVQMFRIGRNVYATQFHPELDIEGITLRIQAYRHFGYFPPEQAEAVIATARRADVGQAHTILRTFARRYAEPSSGH